MMLGYPIASIAERLGVACQVGGVGERLGEPPDNEAGKPEPDQADPDPSERLLQES